MHTLTQTSKTSLALTMAQSLAASAAAIGAIAGDAGKGAAIGATAGGLGRAFKERDRQRAESAAGTTSPAQQAYQRAMAACLEGRGYSVK